MPSAADPACRPLLPPPLSSDTATTVALVAPCGPPEAGAARAAADALAAAFGWRVKLADQALARTRGCAAPPGEAAYLCGSDEARLDALVAAYRDPSVGAVLLLKGGYGCTRLLEALDASLSPSEWRAKRLLGFSDATALLALAARRGAMAVHAPMPATSLYLNGGTLQQAAALRRAVEGATPGEACPPFRCRELIWAGSSTSGRRGLRRRGRAVGGNLCLLAALCGTPYAPDYRGAVLFLEEVGEEPYKLDRMIMQLRFTNALDSLSALVVGDLGGAFKGSAEEERAFWLRVGLPESLPVLVGAPFGHVHDQRCFCVGAEIEVDLDTLEVRCEVKAGDRALDCPSADLVNVDGRGGAVRQPPGHTIRRRGTRLLRATLAGLGAAAALTARARTV